MFHPNSNQIDYLWQTFVERVDPVIKLLHKPTFQKQIDEAKLNTIGLNKYFEALLFSIYFASATSMSEEDCELHFQEAKEVMLNKYRFAVQQSFARADFLRTHNNILLQALVIYMVRISICSSNYS